MTLTALTRGPSLRARALIELVVDITVRALSDVSAILFGRDSLANSGNGIF
jgi:hypothetical protein